MKISSVRFAMFIVLVTAISAFGQMKDMNIAASRGVYLGDPDIKNLYSFWATYLNANPDSVYNTPFWNSEEKSRYYKCDLLNSWVLTPSIYEQMAEYKPTVLGIYSEGEYYKIRTMYSRQMEAGYSDPLAVTDVYAKKKGSSFELFNALKINTAGWQHHTIGSITFICPQYHVFDEAAATRLNKFADSLAMHFGQAPKHVDYYFADTFDELNRARGFVYIRGEGNIPHPQGYSEVHNNIVTASGSGEWYPHEFVHIYAFTPYSAADVMLHEGLATYLGGSHSHSLEWLAHRADSLLKAFPDVNIGVMFADQRNLALDYEVGSNYLFGGVIAKAAFDKGGWEMLRKMMSYGTTPEKGRYRALKELFGIEPKDAGDFIRTKIAEYGRIPQADIVFKEQ